MSGQDVWSSTADELRSIKTHADDLFTKTLTAESTRNALEDKISEAQAELDKLNTEVTHVDSKLAGATAMERILEDSMRNNRQLKSDLAFSVREARAKTNSEKERVQREADRRAAACAELRDAVATDQNEVWSRFPKIASMAQGNDQRRQLMEAVEMLQKRLETVQGLRHQLDAVKKRNELVEGQLKEATNHLQQTQTLAASRQSKEPVQVQPDKASENNESVMEVERDASLAREVEEVASRPDEDDDEEEEMVTTVANHVAMPAKPGLNDGYESCYESGYDSCVESASRPSGNRVARTLIFRSPAKPKTPPPKPHTPGGGSRTKPHPLTAQITPPAGTSRQPPSSSAGVCITRSPLNRAPSRLRSMLSVNLPSSASKKGSASATVQRPPATASSSPKPVAAVPVASPPRKRPSVAMNLSDALANEAGASEQEVEAAATAAEKDNTNNNAAGEEGGEDDGVTKPKKPRRPEIVHIFDKQSPRGARDSSSTRVTPQSPLQQSAAAVTNKSSPRVQPGTAAGNFGKNTATGTEKESTLLQEGSVVADVVPGKDDGGRANGGLGGAFGGGADAAFGAWPFGGNFGCSGSQDTSSFSFFSDGPTSSKPQEGNSFFSSLF